MTAPDTWSVAVPFAKVASEQRLVFGWASIISDESGAQLIFDHHGTMIPVSELESAAYEYVVTSREMGDMHEAVGVGHLIESCVLTPEKRTAMGIDPVGPIGWWVGFRVTDDGVWARIKSGDISAFSIGGDAVKEPVA